jgi:AcrR family transcriptional regulator
MVRIVKDADERRDELLDTALALFLDHGYERTSVEQITATVGVAKGTFYHYFATKQELLEQLVERFTEQLFAEITSAVETTGGDAIARFQTLVAASSTSKIGRRDETLLVTRSLYSDDNRQMLYRMREGWIDQTRPLIADIIERGCAEGVFDVPDVAAFAEVCLSLWFDFGIRIGRLFFEVQAEPSRAAEVQSAMSALVSSVERVLGAAPGSLTVDVGPACDA